MKIHIHLRYSSFIMFSHSSQSGSNAKSSSSRNIMSNVSSESTCQIEEAE